jgi:hypothetical protein
MFQRFTLAAGVAVEFAEPADFFRVLESVPTDLTLIFYEAGREVGRSESIEAGYAEKFEKPFDKVRISSATGGLIEFVTRLGGDVRYDRAPSGNVTVLGQQGAFTQTQVTVTNASTLVKAAKTNRRYLLIQNNDTAGILYVTLDGTAATTAKGLTVFPGGSIEIQGYAPNGIIYAIGSIASNANVIVVEG